MSRYIIIPAPATFVDPGSKKIATVENAEGIRVALAPRDHEWFIHVYMLSHLQFDISVGGAEVAIASKDIGRALEQAVSAGQHFYEVSDDNLRRLRCCIARASDEDFQEARQEKPNPRVLAKSTLGLTRPMDNFTSSCFVDHFNAIENATTVRPEALAKLAS